MDPKDPPMFPDQGKRVTFDHIHPLQGNLTYNLFYKIDYFKVPHRTNNITFGIHNKIGCHQLIIGIQKEIKSSNRNKGREEVLL